MLWPALVKLMLTPHSSLTAPLFLLAVAGLLLLLLRRIRGELFVSLQPAVAGHFAMAMMSSTGGRSSSGTPFPPVAQGELLLVVDDEPSVCELLDTVLTNHGYQVATASDGLEGAKYYAAHKDRVVLVISDMHMPHSDGQSFADQLRAIRSDAKILFMSGMDSELEARPPRSHDPFLLKPFKPAALLQAVDKILHPQRATSA
jgi:CheY-like chemotaxis protein